MAKVISKGWAKPDDPIYRSGLTIGGKRLTPSTPTSREDTAGTKPQEKQPPESKKDKPE